MPRYSLDLLGLNIAFRTDADEDRIQAAKELLEERYKDLSKEGGNISKEKLLTCLALSLADDLIMSEDKLETLEARINQLLERRI